MSDEVDAETQAAMQLKLVDDVRKLIRSELALALQDQMWLGSVDTVPLLGRMSGYPGSMTTGPFKSAVKTAMRNLIDNSY
jgi:hypothetical protein